MKRIIAIYKGQNGSCGFETGKEYVLIVDHPRIGMYIKIELADNVGGFCEYATVRAFLNNWDNIRSVK